MTTMTTSELNNKLQIVNIKDFMFATRNGHVSVNGYAFFIEGMGFVKFKSEQSSTPYTPMGGRKALQSIINAGGFLHYDDIEFINAI